MRKTRAVRKHGGMRTAAYILFAALAGCSSSSSNTGSPGGGGCAKPNGTYRATYTERSGNCGALTEQLIMYDPTQPPQFDPACTAHITESTDNCTVQANLSCPTKTPGQTVALVEIAHWNQSGTQATGESQVTLSSDAGQVICTSVYDMVIVKL